MNRHTSDFALRTVQTPHRPTKALVRLRLIAVLIVLDVLAIKASFFATSLFFIGTPTHVSPTFVIAAVIPLYLICAFLVRAYSGPAILTRGQSIGRALLALLISTIVLGLIVFSLDAVDDDSFNSIALAVAFSSLMTFGIHYLHAGYANNVLGGTLHSTLDLHDGTLPGFRPDAQDNEFGVDTRFFFDPTNPTPASFGRLANAIAGADRIIVHCRDDRRGAWAHVLQGMNVHAEFMATEWNDFRPIGMGEHNGRRTLVVARGPLNFHDRAIKRGFDMAFAAVMLALLSPLFLIVAIAIKLESPGPVFFFQPRIGRQNQLFSLIKFRSMRQDCSDLAGAKSTCRHDPRVTRVGNIIRRISIDELPQLINIIKGDMSVVGPRPHAVSSTAEDRLFWDIDNRYWHRHACRPGLTGLAQIQGFRGATDCVKDLTDRVEADLQYMQGWSFWADIKIVILTFRVIYHSKAF